MKTFICSNSVIAKRGSLQIRCFEPLAGAEQHSANPVLLVPSIINKPYVFDLSEDRSFVRHLLSHGLRVYVMDWGEPRRIDSGLGLVDYAIRLPRFALKQVLKHSGAKQAQLLGYCLGGTFSLILASLGLPEIEGVVALTTPVNLEEPGPMGKLTDDRLVDFNRLVKSHPIIPGPLLYSAFQSLNVAGTSQKMRGVIAKRNDHEFLRRFIDLETWVTDSVDMTALSAQQIVEWLYRENRLFNDELALGPYKISLKDGRVPVLNLTAQWDTVAPNVTSTCLDKVWAGPVETHVFPGGHLGVIVGSKAPANMWAVTSEWLMRKKSLSSVKAEMTNN